MHAFKDKDGREWGVHLNGWQLKKIQEKLGHKCRDPQAVLAASDDPPLLLDILFVLCEAQVAERGLTEQQFCEALEGDALDEATAAYLDESIPFVPRQYRALLAQVLAEAKTAQERATEELTKDMRAVIDKAMGQVQSLLPGTNTGNSSGKPLASLA
jgi:hypothetical protein